MPDPTANYFFQILRRGEIARTGVLEVRLVDEDLVRGNDDIEIRTNDDFDLPRFNGFTRFVPTGPNLDDIERVESDGEVSTEVIFTDGSSISGVLGLVNITSGVGGTSQQFILDVAALEAAGQTYEDIARINLEAFVDHDLTFEDLGFAVSAPDPQPDPQPDPDPDPAQPVFNEIDGTASADRLTGTAEADLITGGAGRDRLDGAAGDDVLIGGDDNDRLTGGAGADRFVFGSDAGDGGRDRDVIVDFDASADTIILEDGASIRRLVERNGDLHIQLDGDRDRIILRDTDASAADAITFVDDIFTV